MLLFHPIPIILYFLPLFWIEIALSFNVSSSTYDAFFIPKVTSESSMHMVENVEWAMEQHGLRRGLTKTKSLWKDARYTKSYDVLWSWDYTYFKHVLSKEKDGEELQDFFRINHLPGSYALTRKNKIYETMSNLQKNMDDKEAFNIVPLQYVCK